MAPDPFNTALMATLTALFPFLYLPLEIRLQVYEYALFTPRGIWLDVDRRRLPPILLLQDIMPSACDIQAAMSPLPIISPALLLVCKQIYHEARGFIRQNTWNLHNWSGDGLRRIPHQIRDRVRNFYLGLGTSKLLPTHPPGSSRLSEVTMTATNVTDSLRRLRRLTLALVDDDQGLNGVKKCAKPTADEQQQRKVPLDIIRFRVGTHFLYGKMKTICLECSSTYPSTLYPFIWVWSWVQELFPSLLPGKVQSAIHLLYIEIDELLGCRGDTTFRNYQLLLAAGCIKTQTGRELREVVDQIKQIWEENGVRVSARDPDEFERGTMVTFERVVVEETDETEDWPASDLVPRVPYSQLRPDVRSALDPLWNLPKWIEVIR